MNGPIETLLFDFGGTLDADGVAWKERFHALYRADGLDVTSDAFARAFYAADDPLVEVCRPRPDLAGTVHALTVDLERELTRRFLEGCQRAATASSGLHLTSYQTLRPFKAQSAGPEDAERAL